MADFYDIIGKTVGVIYTFEGEKAPGFKHYHIWQSDIISKWLLAIQDLKCRPLIFDVRTFVEKAISNQLPHLDFVLNLNCGGCELSPMALVPSVCGFFHIPCIPCNSSSILAGENKLISNLIAKATGIKIPRTLEEKEKGGIFRPLNLGSSIGIKREFSNNTKGLYQEFIRGYDITTPIVYNPITKRMDIMPTVLYISENNTVDWYLGESNKNSRSGFKRKTIYNLSTEVQDKFLELTQSMSINTFCRIDSRIKCSSPNEIKQLIKNPLQLQDLYFIEINPMPTVWINNAFSHSFTAIQKSDLFYNYIQQLDNFVPESNLHNFLLSSAMFALSKAM